MTNTLDVATWLKFLNDEYLATFIHEGGAAVKFAVSLDGESKTVAREVAVTARANGFLTAQVDAVVTRVHMIDQLFFAVSEQVPWIDTVRRVLASMGSSLDFRVPDHGDRPMFEAIAEANDVDPVLVHQQMRTAISRQIFKDTLLDRDFRVAMSYLATAELAGGTHSQVAHEVLTNWLTGRNRLVAPVKPYHIFNRITRANARYLFESTCRWLRLAGYSGLCLTIDLDRLAIARNPRDDKLFYSKAAVMDAYEVLRQFIDGLDQIEGMLLVVVSGPEFLDEEVLGRGIGAYQALKFRVYDEVRDRSLANPLGALMRLAES